MTKNFSTKILKKNCKLKNIFIEFKYNPCLMSTYDIKRQYTGIQNIYKKLKFTPFQRQETIDSFIIVG